MAGFLRAEVRTFDKGHRSVELEPDAPVAAALLWKAIGWSPVFADWVLVEPEREQGEVRIQARLEEYRSWDMDFTLTGSDLPAKRRLVEDDGQGVGFAITDETGGGIDAPILAVIADTNEVVPQSESYQIAYRSVEALVDFLKAIECDVILVIRPLSAQTAPQSVGRLRRSHDRWCSNPGSSE